MEQFEVHVVRGEGLVAKDRTVLDEVLNSFGHSTENTSSDPFVTVVCDRVEVGRTNVSWKCLDPEWNERFQLPVSTRSRKYFSSWREDPERHVCFVLKDKGLFKDDDMGAAWLDLSRVERRPHFRYFWLIVEPSASCYDAQGKILVGARLTVGDHDSSSFPESPSSPFVHRTQSRLPRLDAAIYESQEDKSQPIQESKARTVTDLGVAFDKADRNRDGVVSFSEFRTLVSSVECFDGGEEKLRQVFDEYDTDRSGCVDFSELLERFTKKMSPSSNDEGWPRSAGGTLKVVLNDQESSWSLFSGPSHEQKKYYFRIGSRRPLGTFDDDQVWRRYTLRWWDDVASCRAGSPLRGSLSLHWRQVDIVLLGNSQTNFKLHISSSGIASSIVLDFESREHLGRWWRCLSSVQARTLSLPLDPDSRAVVHDKTLKGTKSEEEDGDNKKFSRFFTPSVLISANEEETAVRQRRASTSLDDEEDDDGESLRDDDDQSSWMALESVKRLRRRVVESIIRPGRCVYTIPDLGPRVFPFEMPDGSKRIASRSDFDVVSKRRNFKIKVSHWTLENDEVPPCIVYVHGNGSCRLDALQGPLTVALAMGASLVALDTAGAGLSDGRYVSIGYHESSDVYDVAEYMQKTGRASSIALWGHSAGAVASLLTASTKAPLLSAVVADSPFTSLVALAKEIIEKNVESSGFVLPEIFVRLALSWVAGEVEKEAGFDISLCDPLATIGCCFVPLFFIHGCDDTFIVPEHSRILSQACASKSRLVLCKNTTHNSQRPVDVATSIARWLQHELCMPATPGLKAYFLNLAKTGRYGRPPWWHPTGSLETT